MAKTVIGLEVSMNASSAEGSVKSLKQQLREAQAEVANMADKFGVASTQAVEAAKRAAELKDRIGDAKALTDAFNPDKKFQAFSTALQGVAGGFAAVQGAMGLMGAESKDVEKMLLKVQSAMALSQGLSAITESIDGFKNLKTVALNALNSIKTAIGSTGIGLLVIALGTIYAYWDDIKGAVNGVSNEQEKLNQKTKANLDAENQKLKQLNNQDNILKLQGKSEKDILKLKISQYDVTIKATEASITQSEITKNAQIKAAERNKEILKGLLNFLSIPITAILYAVDKVKNALGESSNLLEDYKEGLAKMIFDPEGIKKEGDKEIQEQRNILNTLKNDRAGFILQLNQLNKQEKENKKTTQKESNDNELKKHKETNDAKIENTKKTIITQKSILDAFKEWKKEEDAEELEREKALSEAKLELKNTELDALSGAVGILKMFSEKNKALQKAALIAENAITIAKIILNTQTANAAVTAKYALIPGGQPIAAAEILKNKINAGIGIATAIAATAKGLAGIGGGGSAGGGGNLGGGGTPAPIGAQMGGTALQQAQINATGNAAVQAFVLESDVSGNQERIERLNRAARIQ